MRQGIIGGKLCCDVMENNDDERLPRLQECVVEINCFQNGDGSTNEKRAKRTNLRSRPRRQQRQQLQKTNERIRASVAALQLHMMRT